MPKSAKNEDITLHHQQDVLIYHLIAQFNTGEANHEVTLTSKFEFADRFIKIHVMINPVLQYDGTSVCGVGECRRQIQQTCGYNRIACPRHTIKTLLLLFQYLTSRGSTVLYGELLAAA